ncbi:MAG: FkbM family methyltransferase [Burkholderiaceae bacterium]
MTPVIDRSTAIVRAARFWIRYAPIPLFKTWLWARSKWRTYDYRARTRHGNWMKGRSTDLVQGYIYYFGEWEPNLTAWLLKRLAKMHGRVFLDVGANVGYYAILAASRLAGHGEVVAVEASPRIHGMLAENIRLNGLTNIRTVCCAALAEPGSITLYHGSELNLGGSTTSEGVASDKRGVVVEGRRLADILSDDELRRARLIKIDVEGAEWSVMQGLRPVLSRLPQDTELVIEIVPGLMKVEHVALLFDLMESEGYRAYRIDNSYEAKDYLVPGGIEPPRRLRSRPADGGDVVFSRIDADTL